MPRFAANLNWMFQEWPLLDRFEAAAQAGFNAVEILFPYEHPPDVIAERLRRNNLTPALFNMASGNTAAGDRGLAALPERFAELQQAVMTARTYARETGVRRFHLVAGKADRNDPRAVAAFKKSVAFAAEILGADGIEVMLEPINPRDIPGLFLNDFDLAEQLIQELKLPNVWLQFDIYHRQIIHGDVTKALERLMPMTRHIQIASVPSRNEPDGEELNFPFLFGELDRLGYDGFVGCEYRPRGKTMDGLGWFETCRKRSAS
ncbi:2-oxo-tetronate isomerase [Bradyrhizobium sp. LHD-71]|uniref:2-oxo-tetronate isomerase n=1 Tax=Bradyrhizobium sp. LHD-71 TaxID=3072141 RepID=UPI00280FFA44|nr:2-oxo-tetronate isomerase [Bradyrhizobium sp. LHD-71]MDQ8730284.1 TIM barrel protein [Bradyrhizobium sp. LHD-71]